MSNKTVPAIPKEIGFSDIVTVARQFMDPADIDHHESDLYLKCNDISRQIVQNINWPVHVEQFISNIEPHDLWYDIWWAWHD